MKPITIDYNEIFLLDDDQVINLINEEIIKQTNQFSEIYIYTNPNIAIAKIEELIKVENKIPGYFFIDIMLPEIDGFEFIDKVDDLIEEYNITELPNFYILSASNYKRDLEKINKFPYIKGFMSKPLFKEVFDDIFLRVS